MKQYVQYTTGPTDSGQNTAASISPVTDGEPASQAVLQRPSENLRARTEVVRAELEALKYLSDADRSMLLSSVGDVTWAGLPTGTFTVTADVVLRPFMAPASSTPAKLVTNTNAGLTNQVIISTHQLGTTSQKRAYSGANQISVIWQPVSGGVFAVTKSGNPDVVYTITFNSLLTSNTALIVALNANAVFQAGGLVASLGAGTLGTELVEIPSAEQTRRYLSGAVDAEKHILSASTLNSFVSATPLQEGDVLCVWYDALVSSSAGTYGGRRQSINEAPENLPPNNGANIPIGSLFLLRLNPERVAGALPIVTVQDGRLIFVNNRVYGGGESGPLTASGSSYQGSAPYAWANTSDAYIPAGNFEDAVDSIVRVLGAKTGVSGAERIGIQAVAGSPVSIPQGTVHGAITAVQSGVNAHVNNATGAHAASAVSFEPAVPAELLSVVNVAQALDTLEGQKASRHFANVFTAANAFHGVTTFDPNDDNDNAVVAVATGTGYGVTAESDAVAIRGTGDTVGVEGVGGAVAAGAIGVKGTGGAAVSGDNDGGAGVYGKGGAGIGFGRSGPGGRFEAESGYQLGLEVTGADNSNLTLGEGALRIGTANNRLKMGVATTGAAAGTAAIVSQGAANKLNIGVGSTVSDQTTLRVTTAGVGIDTDPVVALTVAGSIRSTSSTPNQAAVTAYGPSSGPGYAVYAQARWSDSAAVYGQGRSSGAGIYGKGEDNVGLTNNDPVGVIGVGGNADTANTESKGGTGIVGVGGDGWGVDYDGYDAPVGIGGTGVFGSGGVGRVGGYGIHGYSGTAGGAAVYAQAVDTRTAAIKTNKSYIQVNNANVPANETELPNNIITSNSLIKAWAACRLNNGALTILNGFNITGGDFTDGQNFCYFNSATAISDPTVLVTVMSTVPYIAKQYFPSNGSGGSLAVTFHSAINGPPIDVSVSGNDLYFNILVMGIQS